MPWLRRWHRRFLVGVWVACVVWALPASSHATPGKPLDKVALQLKWKHQFQFAGYYMAVENGYYRDAGLEVEIREAVEGVDHTHEVTGGRAHFGVGTTELLLDRAKGVPIVVLAVIFQHSPLALAANRQRGIDHVHKLLGRRVMIEPGSAELFALLAREQLPLDGLAVLPHAFHTGDLVEGKVDAMSVYETDELFTLAEQGFPYHLFSARAAGIDFYGDNLFTTEAQLRDHPARTAAFREASLRGWHDAVTRPERAVDLILSKYSSRKSRKHLLFEAEKTIELIMPDVVELGYQYPGRWRHVADTYAEVGMLPQEVSLDGFLYEQHPRRHLPPWVWWTIGTIAAFLVVVSGFTGALLRAARRLDRSERRLREVIDAAPTPIVVSAVQDLRVVYVNRRACDALGISSEEAIGAESASLYADSPEAAVFLHKVSRSDEVVDRELLLKRSDGMPLWVLSSSRVLEFEGKPAVISGFIDLTQRKELEAELRRALQEIQTLRGILPICAHCKKIRTDHGVWEKVEQYISSHSEARFSHGVCPDCLLEHYPEDDTRQG